MIEDVFVTDIEETWTEYKPRMGSSTPWYLVGRDDAAIDQLEVDGDFEDVRPIEPYITEPARPFTGNIRDVGVPAVQSIDNSELHAAIWDLLERR